MSISKKMLVALAGVALVAGTANAAKFRWVSGHASDANSWTVPGNWLDITDPNPANHFVPTEYPGENRTTDIVEIPARANDPELDDAPSNNLVVLAALQIQSGATMDFTGGYDLQVNGLVEMESSVALDIPSSSFLKIDSNTGEFRIDGSALTVTVQGAGSLILEDAAAKINIVDSNDVLIVDTLLQGFGIVDGDGTFDLREDVEAMGGTMIFEDGVVLEDENTVNQNEFRSTGSGARLEFRREALNLYSQFLINSGGVLEFDKSVETQGGYNGLCTSVTVAGGEAFVWGGGQCP